MISTETIIPRKLSPLVEAIDQLPGLDVVDATGYVEDDPDSLGNGWHVGFIVSQDQNGSHSFSIVRCALYACEEVHERAGRGFFIHLDPVPMGDAGIGLHVDGVSDDGIAGLVRAIETQAI